MNTPTNPDNGQSFGGQHHTALAISAAIVFLGSSGSRLLGLVREQLAAGRFGTGNDIAAFTVADNLNTLLFDLLVNGMLQAAFVPVLALLAIGEVAQRGHLRRVGGTLLVLVTGAGLVLAVAGIVAAPAAVSLITAMGGNELTRGEDARQLAIDCTRLILISLPFLGAAAILSAMLYALQKPSGPALGAIARNGAIVVAILILGDAMSVRSMAAGVVAGAALMFLLLLQAARRNNATPHLLCDLHDPAVHRVLKLAVPVFAGLLVSAAVVILDRNLAWHAEEDAVGAMRYATTLVQLVLGLVAAAVSIAALPRLAQAHASAAENPSGFNRELSRSLALVTSLMIPAVVALGVLSTPIVRLLFEHGATDRDASRMIVTALLLYLPGHLVVAWDQVLIFAFYAQQNTILPVTVGVIAAGAYSLTALALFDRHGMAGLVIANSVQLIAHTLIMVWLALRRFGSGAFQGLPGVISKAAVAALAMAATGWLSYRVIEQVLDRSIDSGQLRELITVVVPLVVCAVVYAVAARAVHLRELDELGQVISGKLSQIGRLTRN